MLSPKEFWISPEEEVNFLNGKESVNQLQSTKSSRLGSVSVSFEIFEFEERGAGRKGLCSEDETCEIPEKIEENAKRNAIKTKTIPSKKEFDWVTVATEFERNIELLYKTKWNLCHW